MRKPLTVLAATLAGLTALTAPDAQAAEQPPADTALLVTGDQVVVKPLADGRRTATVVPAAANGIGRVLVHLGLGKKSYEVPAAALPYLGRGLDWSLFDVDAVLHSKQNAKVAVQNDGREQRVLDPGQAKDFGAQLVRKFLDDRKQGRFTEFQPAMSLAGATPRKKVAPLSVMRTLTVQANGPDGKPDSGDVAFAYNVDNGDLLDADEQAQPFYQGVAKFSVPEGHYSVLGLFFETDADNNVTAVRLSAQPEVNVFGDATTRVHAQQASSKVTWVTPKPALQLEGGFSVQREPKTGTAFVLDVGVGAGVPIWVSPVNKPVVTGKLETYPYNRLSSPPGPGTPYEYNLQQATTDGTIPRQRYVIKPQALATVDANYYSEIASVGHRQRAGMYAFETQNFRSGHQQLLPAKQTEYISGDPAIMWYGGTAKYLAIDGFSWFGAQYDSGRSYTAGQSVREDWNRFPLHPAGGTTPDLNYERWPVHPAATRKDDTVTFDIYPFSDGSVGHTGMGYYGSARDTIKGAFDISQNGVSVASGQIDPRFTMQFNESVTLDPNPSTVKLTLDATREGPMYVQSTGSHTEWTWKSGHVAGATLPKGLYCEWFKGEPPTRDCSVEPLMTLTYALGDLDVNGMTHGGPQTLDLTVGHLQSVAGSAITGATVQYSIDGGDWQDASVTALSNESPGNGSYRAAFTAFSPNFGGSLVSLRVTATDAAGGQIAETITNAYRIFR
ncbi:hypothetical protein [Actinocrispum sp. NPDC049592]|uniref:hypothetical protein n=1 Tax=Actinocrispum sp. NPDC049592 TaxID=3154835 RepID=UPI0034261E8D